ncbi:MAG: alanyl-tRNA editing protein [Clostridia bacterium]|nr:alanyl-tRNA editing protein [Clostridia bacterium]
MTKRLFEENAYIKEFTATVVACEQTKNGFAVVLDETAFFPEGGGQAADGGTLNGVLVTDVQIRDNVIYHTTSVPFTPGEQVDGIVDWQIRFARMQSHTAEHLVSGIVYRQFGFSNMGFHMSDTTMTADFAGTLTAEDIAKVETLANAAVYENVGISVEVLSGDCLKAKEYRSKLDLDTDVRLVTIEGYDCCACCAPHVNRTGEIGVIKILGFYPNKGGTRVEMTAGVNALQDYRFLHDQNKELMGLLSAKRERVGETVAHLAESLKATQTELRMLQQQLALQSMETTQVGDVLCGFVPNATYDGLQTCVNSLEAPLKLLLAPSEEGCLYVAASESGDVRPVIQAINKAFNGRGGGKPNYGQGKLMNFDRENLLQLLASL